MDRLDAAVAARSASSSSVLRRAMAVTWLAPAAKTMIQCISKRFSHNEFGMNCISCRVPEGR
jgi:hypothetical protein